jgi:GTP-binding protein
MITDYLLNRERLMCAFVLLDFRLPLQEIDRDFIAQLGTHGVPFALIYTKTDKVRRADHASHTKRIESALLEDWDALPSRFYSSAALREGREELLQYIGHLNDTAGTS